MRRPSVRSLSASAWLCGLAVLAITHAVAHDTDPPPPAPPPPPAASDLPCVNGMAGIWPCSNVDLLSFIPLPDFGSSDGNDIWGWTDSQTGVEYALVGLNDGLAFVDLDDPVNPVYLGKLPTHTVNSIWRDVKVYDDHAFVVSEAPGHGMQVFDLGLLANVTNPPVTFTTAAHYSGFGDSHNIAINEDTGYAYVVGSNTCSGGLHMLDVSTPTLPTFEGCFSADGYTHDTQCVTYFGPDVEHQGREVCFNANEDTLTIVDVTDKAAPLQLSRTTYVDVAYSHQGWLTEDQAYFLLDDELDEFQQHHNTRTRVWDVSDLDAPYVTGFHDQAITSIDHNQYVVGDHTFQGNYRAGLRVLRLGALAAAQLAEVAYFDTFPLDDSPVFSGVWGVYPFFESGIVIVNDIDSGLFVLQPDLTAVAQCSDGLDNDADGAIDFPVDPQCSGPGGKKEKKTGCGLGFELAGILPLLMRRRARARR